MLTHELHPHPKMEEKLGLDDQYVIVDLQGFVDITGIPYKGAKVQRIDYCALIRRSVDLEHYYDDDVLIERLGKQFKEFDIALQLLREKGYGWQGLGLLDTIKEIPEAAKEPEIVPRRCQEDPVRVVFEFETVFPLDQFSLFEAGKTFDFPLGRDYAIFAATLTRIDIDYNPETAACHCTFVVNGDRFPTVEELVFCCPENVYCEIKRGESLAQI